MPGPAKLMLKLPKCPKSGDKHHHATRRNIRSITSLLLSMLVSSIVSIKAIQPCVLHIFLETPTGAFEPYQATALNKAPHAYLEEDASPDKGIWYRTIMSRVN